MLLAQGEFRKLLVLKGLLLDFVQLALYNEQANEQKQHQKQDDEIAFPVFLLVLGRVVLRVLRRIVCLVFHSVPSFLQLRFHFH